MKTCGYSRPLAWYRVMSRTPWTSSRQLDAGRQLAAGLLVGIQVVDEAAEVAAGVGLLPVGREAQEGADVGHRPMRVRRVGAQQVEDGARSLEPVLEDRVRALAPGQVVQLVDGGEQPAQLRPRGAGRW